MKATGEWSDRREQVKTAQHFDCLLQRLLRPQIVAVLHNSVHEQAAVAGEQGAIVGLGTVDYLSIFRCGIVNDIDAKQSQIADEFSEMTIGDKLLDINSL